VENETARNWRGRRNHIRHTEDTKLMLQLIGQVQQQRSTAPPTFSQDGPKLTIHRNELVNPTSPYQLQRISNDLQTSEELKHSIAKVFREHYPSRHRWLPPLLSQQPVEHD